MSAIKGTAWSAYVKRVGAFTGTRPRALAILFVLGVMAGCSSSTTPNEERRMGLLTQSTNGLVVLPLSIEAPDSIARDSSFMVRITTYGTLSCSRVGETETTRRNDTTVVVPFDYHVVDPVPCPSAWGILHHEVTLTADEIGPLVVEVQGLQGFTNGDEGVESVVHHREVVVEGS